MRRAFAAAALGLLAVILAVPERAEAQVMLTADTGSDSPVIGRWREVVLMLSETPAGQVTVSYTLSNINMRSRETNPPEGQTLVFDNNNVATLSVRYVNRRSTNNNQGQIRVAFNTSSGVTGFDGLSIARVDVNFIHNRWHRFHLEYDGVNASNGGSPSSISRSVIEGNGIQVTVSVPAGRERIEPLTISVEVASGGDGRVAVTPETRVIRTGNDARNVTFDVGTTASGAAAGSANVLFHLHTGDGAYESHSQGRPLTFRLSVNPAAAVRATPSDGLEISPGETGELQVNLSKAPAAGNVEVNLRLVALDASSDVVLEISSPARLTFDDTNWEDTQTVMLEASFVDPADRLDEDVRYELRIDTTADMDSEYDGLDDVVIATAVIPASGQGAQAHVGRALGASAAGLGQFALDVVGEQVAAGLSGPQASGLRLVRGGALPDERGAPWSGPERGWRSDFSSLVGAGSGFSLSLGDDGRTNMWARAGYVDYEGVSPHEGETARFDGDNLGLMLGVGRVDGSGRAFGLAVSRAESDTDLSNAGDLASTKQESVAVHPYFGMAVGRDSRAWVVGSLGWGEIEAETAGGETVSADTSSMAVGAGLERAWSQGDLDLALRLEGSFGNTELDGSAGFTAEGIVNDDGSPLSTDYMRARAEIEIGFPYALPAGGNVHPYMLLGARVDGGDLEDVVAVEAGGGLRATVGDAYDIDLKARMQVNDADLREHSFSGRVSYDSGRDGRGLTGSLERVLEEGGLEGSLGYGWGASVFGQHGAAGPSLGYVSSGEGLLARFGFVSPRLRMGIEGGDEEVGLAAEYRVLH